jgi:hypothetical protein
VIAGTKVKRVTTAAIATRERLWKTVMARPLWVVELLSTSIPVGETHALAAIHGDVAPVGTKNDHMSVRRIQQMTRLGKSDQILPHLIAQSGGGPCPLRRTARARKSLRRGIGSGLLRRLRRLAMTPSLRGWSLSPRKRGRAEGEAIQSNRDCRYATTSPAGSRCRAPGP